MRVRPAPPTPLGLLAAVLLLVAAAGLWEGAARWGWLSSLVFPPPSAIGRALVRLGGGPLIGDLLSTARRLILGLLIAVPCGVVVGWLAGGSRRLGWYTDAALAAAHPIPKISLLPLFLLFFGLGDPPKVAVIALAGFFPIAVSTAAGVRATAAAFFDVAAAYGLSRWRGVVVPGSLPMFFVGLRIAASLGLLSCIASEMIAGSDGLGYRVWFSWEVMRPEELYATLLVVSLLGFGMTTAVHGLRRVLLPWLRVEERVGDPQ